MIPDRIDPEQVRSAARLLVEHKAGMDSHAAAIRLAQRRLGHDIDLRAEYAEGSAAAYAIACTVFAAAFGVSSIDELTGEDWRPQRGMLPPMLPDRDAIHGMPNDTVTVAAVAQARRDPGDHFAYPDEPTDAETALLDAVLGKDA